MHSVDILFVYEEKNWDLMPHIVAEPCVACRHTNCVAVCPVNCFHKGPNFLVIDPEKCIDCRMCVPECPVNAIYEEDELPEQWQEYVELNRRFSAEWPIISGQIEPLPEAASFRDVAEKRHLLEE